ncbi:UPF0182 family protein [Methylosoma difficile]
MRNLKFLPALIGATVVIASILYVAFYFVFLDLFVDLWWFQSLKLEAYFWLKLLYKFFLSGGVTLAFFTIFFFHFWIASSYLGLNPPEEVRENPNKLKRFHRLANVFIEGSAKIYTPVSLLLAIFVALPFYNQWETSLLFFFGDNSGVADSIFGNDVSFYMLSYPTYLLIQKELLGTAALIFCMVAFLYWVEHTVVPHQRKNFPIGAKIHLTVLIAFVFGFVVWGFMLQRYTLLYTNSHEPIFYGPGFVEIRYQVLLIWLAIATFLVASISAVCFVFSEMRHAKTPFLLSAMAFFAVLGLEEINAIPELLQRYVVNPNPVKTEKPFIQHNIEATLNAYKLNNVKTVDMTIRLDAAKDIETWGTQKRFENIPVWDREFIIDSYRQLQEIRPYYKFLTVDEDRYFALNHLRQVNISAREVNIAKMPPEAQNWENKHLRYTHGYGAVVTPAAQDADKPQAWYLRDLNMSSEAGFSINHPDIYYGQEDLDYAIVPNKLDIVGIAGSDPSFNEAYHGEGGIPIPSYFRKALLAIYLNDEKIFFSSNISTESKVKIRRNITDRITHVVPFLHLDKDPYLVMTKDRFYWLQDAYTLSDKYPAAKPSEDKFLDGEHRFNYIRNSVKIVVDAFDGDVDFYVADNSDVLINAYSKAYPSLFKKIDDMPTDIKEHLRYPRDLYYQQMKMYAKYHQQSPELFYEQAETWQFANVREQTVMPYYQTMDFGNCNDQEEFVLIDPMTPINRTNLSMIGVAGTLDGNQCGGSYHPNITVYKFGKDVQVNGPAQIEALTQQVPEISAQFTLWGQQGSVVEMGRMIILPMGSAVLYVQPIYLAATKNKMPELTRVIVSIGNETVMDKTLASAFDRLKEKFIKNESASLSNQGKTAN